MNKTRKIITIILVLCVALTIAGCSSSQKPSDAINEAVKAVQNMDKEKIMLYYGKDVTIVGDVNLYTPDVVQALAGRILYTVDSVKKDGNMAQAQVTFTNVNMGVTYSKFFTALLNDDYLTDLIETAGEEENAEINVYVADLLAAHITADDAQMMTTSVTVKLEYDEDNKIWRINWESVHSMVNAMLGDIYGGIN